MPTVHLTDRTIRSLKTDKDREMFWDDVLTGFGVRVTRQSKKTFILRYRLNGKRPRMTLGTYPPLGLAEARVKARSILVQTDEGFDPTRAEEDS